jgi:hypothetical protein
MFPIFALLAALIVLKTHLNPVLLIEVGAIAGRLPVSPT